MKNIKELNILVTGCGGDIGYGVGRILKRSGYGKAIIGTDITDDHGGLSIFDKCLVISRADSSNYLSEIERIIHRHLIDIIIPCSEAETKCLSDNGLIEDAFGAIVIAPNKKAFDICADKLKTVNFLQKEGLLYPWTVVVGEGEPKGLPCIIKNRSGAGSKNLCIITKENLEMNRTRKGDIWQELLLPDDEEYTCGIFRSKFGISRFISFNRKLHGGHTVSGRIIENDQINLLLSKVAESLHLVGSINAQLRLTLRGPVIFEINPRFSSTLGFRDLLGFKDVIWSIDDKLGLPLKDYDPPKAGTRIYRYAQEIIIKNKDLSCYEDRK